jgi:MFS family permease
MKRIGLPGGYSPSFYLAFLACFLFFSSVHLIITPLPLYIQQMGGGATQVGLAQTSFAISSLIVRPYMGRLTDTRGRKPALLLGATVFVLAPLCYTQVRTLPALHLARLFHGIGIAAFTTAFYTLLADITPPSRWGAAMGLGGIAPSFAMVLASPAGTTLLQHTSFTVVFLAASLIGLGSLVVALAIAEPRHQVSPSPTGDSTTVGLLDVARMPRVVAPSLAMLTVGLTYGTLYAFLPLFVVDRDLGNAGLFFTALSLALVPARSTLGRLSDRVGRLPVVLPMFGILALSVVGLNWAYSFGTLIAMAVLLGIGFGGSRVGLETIVVDTAPALVRGRALSLIYFCFDLGIGVAGLAIGAVADLAGYGQAYLLVGAACLLTALLFGAVMRKPARA